ncbi:carboxymuconolactone decarboxylase family protein [Halomonas hibernica]|uniref:carboxymuconolactone decarboxylase family protein n=1 Tax=Halomonas hibernica TaxID=2591147 RepID=UPI0020A6284F|nr:carboxymuconolactone decarboxylase family protein [Halomonas hibernica]
MSQRISRQVVYKLTPRLAKHLVPLGEVAANSAVTPTIIHLVQLRVSQINQCCFCQHMHTQEARDDGEHQVRWMYCLLGGKPPASINRNVQPLSGPKRLP